MTGILIDKIGSVTKNLELAHKQEIMDDPAVRLPCDMGTVLAAKILEDKTIYNELELPSGRFSKLKKSDVVAVVLGERLALKGFVGVLPKSLYPGDMIHLLNMGGVAGECTSANVKAVGQPLRIRILGGIVRDGQIANINQKTLFAAKSSMQSTVPLIIVTGTSMDSGKTTVAVEITKTLSRMGMKLAGAKLTGVGALRDLYKMHDYGVYKSVSFVDAGIPSTANLNAQMITEMTKGALDYLSQKDPAHGNREPDAIIVEFGDGLMGKYGVEDVLKIPEIKNNVRLHIGCANDPVGAAGLVRSCASIGVPLDIVSGPVTDNDVGKNIIHDELGVMSYNAFNPTTEWMDLIISRWLHAYQLSA
ncbi:MAG: hypothetical protein KAJ29_01400 [Alphaproteobacteria bacterium]|nr:hypothetical protein [Alphaproteobacteria bacterium]